MTVLPRSAQARFAGSLVGLAVGDALGAAVEFKKPGTFEPVTGMRGGGPHGLEAGQWTDDTSMALCLAESLLACAGFDAKDQADRYVRWYRTGYMSHNGRCFDIGNITRAAVEMHEETQDVYCGNSDKHLAGNGSIMRLAPVPLFFASDPSKAIQLSGESSILTHGSSACIDACRYLGALLVGAARGEGKEELLSERYGLAGQHKLFSAEIDSVAAGSFKDKEPPEIEGTGYVVKSLEAALWAFYKSSSFKEGCLMAVNLGDDADTTGAVFGQLAGAYYGIDGIPPAWLESLAWGDMIEEMGAELWNRQRGPGGRLAGRGRLGMDGALGGI